MATALFATTDPPPPQLELLVRNLDLDTVRCKRLIRQLLETDEAAFLRNATQVFERQTDSNGARFILGLLAERGLLVKLLCMPAITKESAVELARAALAAAPSTDIQIARSLADMLDAPETSQVPNQITRLMDVLGEISVVSRVFPSIVRLMRHPNPHVRSKAVLMIGKQSRSAQWVRHRLSDTDPRIRANALEALWNVDTAEAKELLESFIHDSNNRVAGNALLGLYRLGDVNVISEILTLAGHESPLFRSTAAWVMGETGDPRFAETLATMLRESHPVVRKRAFSAIGQLRAALARSAQAPPCRLAGRMLESSSGQLRIALTVSASGGWPPFDLLPTQFVITEDGRPVNSYRVAPRPVAETFFTIFLLPAKGNLPLWREAALACAPWKRASDLWSCGFYDGAGAPATASPCALPPFHTSLDAIRADLARTPARLESPDLWRSIRKLADGEAAVGKRHLMIFRDEADAGRPPDDALTLIAAAQLSLHILSTVPDPELEDVCRKSNGAFTLLQSADQAVEATVYAYLRQLPQYELSWQPLLPGPHQCKIRIHGPAAGEIVLQP